ncbi:MAG: winged helix-turn-helix transcriptional regulator [Candidatus Izemoplasmatales bacterium]|nr:winged helix-turn-helix transcriptional regulator [Candidatus Izemoplasmatales bacterium]
MLNTNEKKILKILEENPFINQQAIAEKISLSRPAIANIISGLQDKGYILGKPYLLKTDEYITCVGGANLDYIFDLQGDMIRKTSNPVKASVSLGGVIRNVADNLARLDQKVSLMTLVGSDADGEKILNESKKLMDIFATDKLDYYNTGSYYAVIDKAGEMQVGFADMEITKNMNRQWVLEHKRHLILSSWVIADLNITIDAMESLIEFARAEDKRIAIIGVSGPKMKNLPADLKAVDLIICNRDETQSYFNTDEENLLNLVEFWKDKGVKRACVTAGKQGMAYLEDGKTYFLESLIISNDKIVDVTGAGDAFSAALLYGLITKESMARSLEYARMSAALTIQDKCSVNPILSINLLKREIKNYGKI